jgi:multidrug resistance efflux pump
MKTFKLIAAITLVSLLLSACGSLPGGAGAATPTPLPTVVSDANIVAEGRVVPAEDKTQAFFTSGQVEEVLVSEDEVIKKDQLLARLGNREQLQAAIAGAEAELVAANQARKQLDDDHALALASAADAIAAANKSLKDTQYQLDNFTVPQGMLGLTPLEAIAKMKDLLDKARDRFEPYKYYPSTNNTREDRKEDLDTAQSDYNTAIRWLQLDTNVKNAQTRLDQAMQDYETLSNGPDPDQVESAEARIKAAQANLEAAKAAVENLDLFSTIDGTIVQMDLVQGQMVTPGTPVMRVADLSELFAETDDLTEIEVVDVAIGQKVTVVADALPDVEMTGVVESIKQVYEEKRGDITYTVKIKLDNPDPRLRWGMTVVITFQK